MDSTLEEMAAALGIPPLNAEQQTVLLDCTRDVAHRTQRRNAPLAAYLAGIAVAQSGSSDIALKAAVAVIRSVLPPQDQPDD
jgi:hypothetical protein